MYTTNRFLLDSCTLTFTKLYTPLLYCYSEMMSTLAKTLIFTALLGVLGITLKSIWEILKKTNGNVDCSLYMTTSAMRGTGSGVFAGKDFQIGEKLIPVSSVVHMRLDHVRYTLVK